MDTSSFKEDHISQVLALQLFVNLSCSSKNLVEATYHTSAKTHMHYWGININK
ncbi:MAG: hypothetical protein MH472_00615 [Bacteroidia bacterium]|nr:hypothetical protein [Bacteroidia bacterium]